VEQVKYYNNGNIHWKRDLGYYCYSDDNPHAVSGIGSDGCNTKTYQYDNNGNMKSGRGRNLTYTDFDKVDTITNSEGVTNFNYDASRSRYQRVTTDNSTEITTTTYYIGNVEVVSKSDSNVVTTRRHLPGAIELHRSNGTHDISYLHKDHLGSIDTITNDKGEIKQKLYFDAWGKKHVIDSQNIISSLASQTTLTFGNLLDIGARGFTGHETVEEITPSRETAHLMAPVLGGCQ